MDDSKVKWTDAGQLLQYLAIWGGSFISLLAVGMGVVFLSGWIADSYYNSQHQISNPASRGDDLGLGLVVIAVMAVVFLIVTPLVVYGTSLMAKYLINKIMREE